MPDRDTVIDLAAKAGFPDCAPENHKIVSSGDMRDVHEEFLTLLGRFAALVAAQEREACALVCEAFKEKTLAAQSGPSELLSNVMLRQIAELGFGEASSAIQARKEETP